MTDNLPKANMAGTALSTDFSAMGLEDISHADTAKKYLVLDNHTGKISMSGSDVDLVNPFLAVPIKTYEEWQYVTPDGSQVVRRDLIHQKSGNLGLEDGAHVMVKDFEGRDQETERVRARVFLLSVQDMEAQGPMFLTLRKSKLWAAQNTLMSKLLENKEKKLPIFGQSFYIGSEQKSNKKNQKFWVYTFKAGDLVTDNKKLGYYASMYMELTNSQEKLLSRAE